MIQICFDVELGGMFQVCHPEFQLPAYHSFTCKHVSLIHDVYYLLSMKMFAFDVHLLFSSHRCKSDVSLVQNNLAT